MYIPVYTTLKIKKLNLFFFQVATKIEQHIIDQVRNLRIKQGISIIDFAYEMGFSRGFVAAIENPKSRAKYNINHLNKIVKILDCSFADLFPAEPFDDEE